MNRVSNLEFALVGHANGVIPSIVLYNYIPGHWQKHFDTFKHELTSYVNLTKSTNLVVGIKPEVLANHPEVSALLLKLKPKHIEIFDTIDPADRKLTTTLTLLRKSGCAIFTKALGVKSLGPVADLVDGIVVKGPDAAARVGITRIELLDKISMYKEMYPDKILIASGGISTSRDIVECLQAGASLVSIGTMFAMSAESPIAIETKNKLLDTTFSQVKNIGNQHQNAVVFTEVKDIDGNHTAGLELGVASPDAGHVFIGKAIDTINEIKPFSSIVKELVKDL